MASRRARERQDAYTAKHHPERWECQHWSEERDQDDDEIPDREEPEPIHTNH